MSDTEQLPPEALRIAALFISAMFMSGRPTATREDVARNAEYFAQVIKTGRS